MTEITAPLWVYVFLIGWVAASVTDYCIRLYKAWRASRVPKEKVAFHGITIQEAHWMPSDKIMVRDTNGKILGVYNLQADKSAASRYMDHVASRLRAHGDKGSGTDSRSET